VAYEVGKVDMREGFEGRGDRALEVSGHNDVSKSDTFTD
jgi:hypothetical protein